MAPLPRLSVGKGGTEGNVPHRDFLDMVNLPKCNCVGERGRVFRAVGNSWVRGSDRQLARWPEQLKEQNAEGLGTGGLGTSQPTRHLALWENKPVLKLKEKHSVCTAVLGLLLWAAQRGLCPQRQVAMVRLDSEFIDRVDLGQARGGGSK